MDDLVNRLRDRAYSSKVPDPLCELAALEIEWLRDVVMLRLDAILRNGAVAGCETVSQLRERVRDSRTADKTDHDAAPAARAQVDAAGISRQGTGDTPVTEPIAKEKLAETSDKPCPYVTGTVTRYCTLTPLTLTDAEREAVEQAIDAANGMGQAEPWTMRTLRGLLDRTK